eukprot:SAG31_NODE_92_length_26360_cov_29.601881_12_plen_117_part_00
MAVVLRPAHEISISMKSYEGLAVPFSNIQSRKLVARISYRVLPMEGVQGAGELARMREEFHGPIQRGWQQCDMVKFDRKPQTRLHLQDRAPKIIALSPSRRQSSWTHRTASIQVPV